MNEEYLKYINLLEGEVSKQATRIVEKLSLLKITSWGNYHIIDGYLTYLHKSDYLGLDFSGYYEYNHKYMLRASNEIKVLFLKNAPGILAELDEEMNNQIADIKEMCDV